VSVLAIAYPWQIPPPPPGPPPPPVPLPPSPVPQVANAAARAGIGRIIGNTLGKVAGVLTVVYYVVRDIRRAENVYEIGQTAAEEANEVGRAIENFPEGYAAAYERINFPQRVEQRNRELFARIFRAAIFENAAAVLPFQPPARRTTPPRPTLVLPPPVIPIPSDPPFPCPFPPKTNQPVTSRNIAINRPFVLLALSQP